MLAITGRTDDWAEEATDRATGDGRSPAMPPATRDRDAGELRPHARRGPAGPPCPPYDRGSPLRALGVQLAGNFSKARALASFQRAGARHRAIIGDLPPMVIGTRLRSRGTRAFYRVRLPAATRAEAAALCRRIQSDRGARVVLRS